MKTSKLTVTSRTRLGYGWTSQPVQGPNGLNIKEPREESRGGWRQIEAAHLEAARQNNGNDWCGRIFVNGKTVVNRPSEVFYMLEACGAADVVVYED
jgi:hypothetical protein